ncbi:hypothetical protein [Virgibacillus pantothenticus]|uniref:hypothetical protein n=1 Tax=Virgibacillus pantothenticus TaxID=1473 RepID=UPI001BAFEDE1|nr:hypothetical protein [Virgibacillus pantothenticus]
MKAPFFNSRKEGEKQGRATGYCNNDTIMCWFVMEIISDNKLFIFDNYLLQIDKYMLQSIL